MLERSGFAPRQPLRQGPAADPRDLPARRAVRDLRRRPLRDRRSRSCTCRSAAAPGCSCGVDDYGRYVSCLVFLPRDRYTTSVRLRMEEILREAFGGTTRRLQRPGQRERAGPAALRRPARRRARELPRGGPRRRSRRRLVEATRSWDEDLADALRPTCGEEEAARLLRAGAAAFPEAYKEDFPARVGGGGPAPARGAGRAARGRAEARHEPLRARRAPRAASAGSSSTGWRRSRSRTSCRYLGEPGCRGRRRAAVRARTDRRRRRPGSTTSACATSARGEHPERHARAVQEAFAAAWSGAPRATGSTGSCCGGGLTWRQVVVLRAYAKYLRQAGTTFSQDYIERAPAARTSRIARLLVRLFEARFDPDVDRATPTDGGPPAS